MSIWEQFKVTVQEDPSLLFSLLLMLLLLWLLLQIFNFLNPGSNRENNNGSETAEDYQRRRDHEASINKSALQKLLDATQNGSGENKELAESALKSLLNQAGVHQSLQDVSADAALIDALSQELDMETILGYSLALDINLPHVKAQHKSERVESLFPTLTTDVEMATTPEDILNATPEELYQREETYDRYAAGELQVVKYYENIATEAILHMVVDVSNSMLGGLRNGVKKSIIARAVAYKLLTRARIGAAKFLLRFFDGEVHELKRANTPEEAQKLANYVRDNGFSGGGTEILGGIKAAVRDIRKEMKNSPNFAAEIMLITDGEPNTPFTAEELREILGDIKLHAVIIGEVDNDSIKAVATSYTRFQ